MKYLLGLFMNKIIFSLIIMFSSGFLHAEQLRFMLELSNKENLYLLDAESIEKSGKLVRVWMKTISNPKYIQSGQASYTMTQWEVNCGARKIQALKKVSYSSGGNVISSMNQPGDLMSIVPESRGSEYYKIFCNPKFPNMDALSKPVDNSDELAKTVFKVYEESAK